MQYRVVVTGILVALAAALLAPAAQAATGTTIRVNTPNDVVNPTDGLCSLREAITSANRNRRSGRMRGECAAGSRTAMDTVKLDPHLFLYSLSIAGPGENGNATGDLDVMGKVKIAGTDKTDSFIDAGALDRVFDVLPHANVILSKVTVTNGAAPAGGEGAAGEDGGGLRVATGARLRVLDSDVSNNVAGNGGDAMLSSEVGGDGGNGGGIASTGSLTLVRTTVTSNHAGSAGAGVSGNGTPGGVGGDGGGVSATGGSARFVLATISSNFAGDGGTGGATATVGGAGGDGGEGGGVFGGAAMTFDRTTVDGDTSGAGGSGGIGGVTGGTGGVGGDGGGIWSDGPLTIRASTISRNHTAQGGLGGTVGGLNGRDGAAGGILRGPTSTKLFALRNSTISDNASDGDVGGVALDAGPARFNNVTIASNDANDDASGSGTVGGLLVGSATVTMSNSLITHNNHDGSVPDDCAGTVHSLGFNFVATNNCGGFIATDDTNTNTTLAPLGNNGGHTETRALLTGDAIDGASPRKPGSGGNACETHDQRGIKRPQHRRCDAGAYEKNT